MTNTGLDSFLANGSNIEVVKSFVLLGSTIEAEGDCRVELRRRMALGKAAMGALDKIWRDRDITVATKIKLADVIVFPVALYGCETWTLRETDRRKVDAFQHWCWRRMLRIPWTAKRTNASIRDQVGVKATLYDRIAGQKLAYCGHIMRSDGLEKSIMLGMGAGQRKRGRPRRRWMDEVKDITGKSLQELKEMARDRDMWRIMVRAVTKGRMRPDGTR